MPLERQRIRQLTADVNQTDLLLFRELIEAGKVRPIVDRTYPLSEVAKAIRHWEEGHTRGKVFIAV